MNSSNNGGLDQLGNAAATTRHATVPQADKTTQDAPNLPLMPEWFDEASRPAPLTPPVKKPMIESIDLSQTPIKLKQPPWMQAGGKLKQGQQLAIDEEIPKWFTESQKMKDYIETNPSSDKLAEMKVVETRIRNRFPNCQPMFGNMVEFITQATSNHVLSPVFHTDSLIGNDFATALPLIHFTNLISSKALLTQVGMRQFKNKSSQKNTNTL